MKHNADKVFNRGAILVEVVSFYPNLALGLLQNGANDVDGRAFASAINA